MITTKRLSKLAEWVEGELQKLPEQYSYHDMNHTFGGLDKADEMKDADFVDGTGLGVVIMGDYYAENEGLSSEERELLAAGLYL
jgi:hypothetical protein